MKLSHNKKVIAVFEPYFVEKINFSNCLRGFQNIQVLVSYFIESIRVLEILQY